MRVGKVDGTGGAGCGDGESCGDGGKVVEMGGSYGDGGAMKVVWIREVCNCVTLLAPCDRLILKLHRVFGDTGRGRGMTGEHGQFGV